MTITVLLLLYHATAQTINLMKHLMDHYSYYVKSSTTFAFHRIINTWQCSKVLKKNSDSFIEIQHKQQLQIHTCV